MIHALRLLAQTLVAVACLSAPAFAATGGIHGTTTTQDGAVRLPGVEVIVTDASDGRRVAVVVSDGTGRFAVRDLPAGRYRIVARLSGFSDRALPPVSIADGEDREIDMDLAVAPVTEDVKVVGQAGLAQTETSLARDTIKGTMIDYLPVAGDNYRALLPVLPGVVRAPDGRISLKGARESQGALQVGRGYANDPSTGGFGIELPADSVESVDVVANPYGAEDGRFSSTVVKIETRAGTNEWSALANGFVPIPCLKICDGVNWGIRTFRPRGWFGGPLIKDRLFISQGAQFRFVRVRVPGLPLEADDTTDYGFETFTRLDANLSPSHLLETTFAFFPRRTEGIGLNTFRPIEATPSFRLVGYRAAVSEGATLTPTVMLESSFTASVYNADVFAEGNAPQEATVDGTRGNYFNTQARRTRVVQWTESVTSAHTRGPGDHVLKAGGDIMWASFDGSSLSRPVIVRRADGTMGERLDFGAPTGQRVEGVDAAAFVQDRWRLSERFLVEPGVRIEHDGVARQTSVSPRLGLVVGVVGNDVGVLRGGAGVFYERTPLNVGAFRSIEAATETRFAADGVTSIGSPVTFVHRQGDLRTPRSTTWNIEYDHRVGSRLFLKVNHLERSGSGIAIVRPVESDGASALWLDSGGSSRYVETEFTARYGATDLQQVSITYVRSHATSHLNVFDSYFGNFRNPIVRADQYAVAPTDVPNRILLRGVATLQEKWTLSSLVEIRTGFPYSVVDENQEFVGIRNSRRFPGLYTLDASLIRSATVAGRPVRFGVRVYHLLNNFAPRDVQNNVDSPAFGTFYNSIPRRVSLTFTFLSR